VALGRQLGAEAINEPRMDVAMLLAREAVNLSPSPQTEGTLLFTLLRNPAVIGTFALPTNSAPELALSPDGRTLAVGDGDLDEVHFYDARTRTMERPPLTDFIGTQPPAYSADGSLLVYPAGAFLAVRNAQTLALIAKLPLENLITQEETAQIPDGSILVSPDRKTVFYAYWLLNAAGRPAAAYIDRWSLPDGRRLSNTRIGSGALFAFRLVDGGTRLVVVGSRTVSLFDARTFTLLASIALPPSVSPSAAAVSPDGRTAVIGSRAGAVSFVDLTSGAVRRISTGQRTPVAGVVYSPDGRTVVSFGDDNQVVEWDPKTLTEVTTLSGPLGRVQNAAINASGTTLYTASLDGVMLAWDLTGRRGFGHRSTPGAPLPCCDPVSPSAPPPSPCRPTAADSRRRSGRPASACSRPRPSSDRPRSRSGRPATSSPRSRGRPPAPRSPSPDMMASCSSGAWMVPRDWRAR
jgi:DNA-binding beta-propeller fold protein YncE